MSMCILEPFLILHSPGGLWSQRIERLSSAVVGGQ